MKMSHWLRVFLGFLILHSINVIAYPINSTMRVNPVSFDGHGLFSWAKRGTLLSMYTGRGKINWYVYCDDEDQLSVITNNLSASTYMIRSQLDSVDEAVHFLRQKLADVALSFFGPTHAYIIDEQYVENRTKARDFAFGRIEHKDMEKTLSIINKYKSNKDAVITDNNWRLTFFVTLVDGSVERWNIDGDVFPFAISHLEKASCEVEGTVVPMPEF